jgi:hypothetical protein
MWLKWELHYRRDGKMKEFLIKLLKLMGLNIVIATIWNILDVVFYNTTTNRVDDTVGILLALCLLDTIDRFKSLKKLN